ncbi:MAG: hypothetical protein RIR79_1674 [Pseudomonadota bacterium]|jgi:hypothetical protein
MSYVSRAASLFLFSTLLVGCSSIDLKEQRLSDLSEENKEIISENTKIRAAAVAENETYFTNNLRCIGNDKIFTTLPQALDGSKRLRISVGPIYDKTTKVFPQGSTAISDMVINALSYFEKVNIVDVPLSGDITESRVNFLSPQYFYLGDSSKNQINNFAGKLSHAPFGVLFPSHYYITGALVRYDEGAEIKNPSIDLKFDALTTKKEVRVITAGLHLRLVSSTDGEISSLFSKGARGSVLLSSKYYKITMNADLFKLVNDAQYGITYSVDVADPQHYVIQEMVEKGVADLLFAFTSNDDCSTAVRKKS